MEKRSSPPNRYVLGMYRCIGKRDLRGALACLEIYLQANVPLWMEGEDPDPVSENDFLRALDGLLKLVAIADRNGLSQLPLIGSIPGLSRRAGTSPGLLRILKSLDAVRDRMERRLAKEIPSPEDHPFKIKEPLETAPRFRKRENFNEK